MGLDQAHIEWIRGLVNEAVAPVNSRIGALEMHHETLTAQQIESASILAEMRSLLAEARGAAMVAENAVEEVINEAAEIASSAGEAVEDAIDSAMEDAENTVEETVDESEALIDDLPKELAPTDEGPERKGFWNRKIANG